MAYLGDADELTHPYRKDTMGGSLGEMWGQVAPSNYFMIFVWTSVIGAAVLLPLIIPLKRLMHEVK